MEMLWLRFNDFEKMEAFLSVLEYCVNKNAWHGDALLSPHSENKYPFAIQYVLFNFFYYFLVTILYSLDSMVNLGEVHMLLLQLLYTS